MFEEETELRFHSPPARLVCCAAWRLPRRPAVSRARAAGGHRAELQGVHRQLPDTDGWKVASPQDAMIRGNWWEVFNEPELNALEEQLNINNQNLKEYFENYMAAAPQLPRRARNIGRRSPRIRRGTGRRSSGNSEQLHPGQRRQDLNALECCRLMSRGRPISGARSVTKCTKRNTPRR